MDASMEVLLGTGWLSQQPAPFCDWIVRAGYWRKFKRSELIFGAGDPVDGLIGVVEGAIDIFYPAFDHKNVMLTREGRGFWIGDLALLARKARLVSAYAGVPTEAFFVPRGAILAVLREYPDYWHAFYQLSYENQENALVVLSETLSLPVTVRVARRLRHLSGEDLTVRISQQGLADLLGTTRSHLQRSLAALARQDLIETGYNVIRIKDLAGLNAAASGQATQPLAVRQGRVLPA